MAQKIQVKDFTISDEEAESAVLVYFEDLQGTVHVYRDGTVVLSSPAGTTVTSLRRIDDPLWRREQFMGMLARLGASEKELAEAAQTIASREKALSRLGFPAATEQVSRQSVAHFKAWCQRQGLDYETMTEEDIDRLLEDALARVRTSQ
jgi:hypothetical protein